jgi:hypothetical protein
VNGIFQHKKTTGKKERNTPTTFLFVNCHLNINSMRYKFDEIKELLFDKGVDCLIVSARSLGKYKKQVFSIVAQRSSRCPYTLLLIELPTPVLTEAKIDNV